MRHVAMRATGSVLALAIALPAIAGSAADPPTPPTNAAEAYRTAFAMLEALEPELLDRLDAARGDPGVLTGTNPDLLAEFALVQPALDAFRAAASIESCDWGVDRSDGFMMLLPHLSPMRSFARLASLEATLAIAEGDAVRATAALDAMRRSASHIVESPVLIDSLVAGAVLSTLAKTADVAGNAGLVDAALAERLLEIVPDRSARAIGIVDAMNTEVEMVGAELDRLADGGEGIDPDLTKIVAVDPPNRERTLDLLAGFADDATEAMLEEDPDRRDAMIEEIERRIAELPQDDSAAALVSMIVPSYRAVARSIDRLDGEFGAVRDRLEMIAKGEGDLATANAAYWYLRTVSRLRSIPPRAQVALELARQAPDAVDPAMAEEIADWLARLEGAEVLATLRQAATIDACDFTFGDDRRRSSGDVLLHEAFPAIRAGARILIVSAARALREAEGIDLVDSEDAKARSNALRARAIGDLAAAISIARHLALDGTPGGTATAASICNETAAALSSLEWKDADPESIRQSIGRLPRTAPWGPLGAEAAEATARAAAERLLAKDENDAERPASLESSLRGLASAGDVPKALLDASEAPLLAADDLVAIEIWEAWRALANQTEAQPATNRSLFERLVIVGEVPSAAVEWGLRPIHPGSRPESVGAAIDMLDRWSSSSRAAISRN